MIGRPSLGISPRAPLLLRNLSGLKFDGASLPGVQGFRRTKRRDMIVGEQYGRDGLLWYSHNPWFSQSVPTGDDAFRLRHLQNHPFRTVNASVTTAEFGARSSETNNFGNCPVFNHGTSTGLKGHGMTWLMRPGYYTWTGTVGGWTADTQAAGGWTLLAEFKPSTVDTDHRCFFSTDPKFGVANKGACEIGFRNQSGHYSLRVAVHNGAALVAVTSPNIQSYQDADGYYRLLFHFNSHGNLFQVPFVSVYSKDGVLIWGTSTDLTAGTIVPSAWSAIMLGRNYTGKENNSWNGTIGHMSAWSGDKIKISDQINWWRDPWWFLREESVPTAVLPTCDWISPATASTWETGASASSWETGASAASWYEKGCT